MIIIYTGKTTNRLRYIFEHILKYVLGLKVRFTDNIEEFRLHVGAKINYSSCAFCPNELFFYASPLLFERRIKPQQLKIENFEDTKIFFISKNNSDLPFDIFAASFYLISRYEEYLPDATFDQHKRYMPENSLAYKHQFLQQPIVDIWIKKLEIILKRRFPDLAIRRRPYHFIPTYDIDIAYAYSHKGFLRTTAGWLHALYKRNFDELNMRLNVLQRREIDPYDTYEWQYQLQKKYELKSIYFFLLGDYGQYDKNLPVDSLALHELIRYLSDISPIGIHPSYESNNDIQKVAEEIMRLSHIVKKEVRRSRQHYLRLNIPDTYQKLLELDVEKDYTMGYASQLGFRAGTASSFYFYDLNLEIKTNLRVYPFAVMDVTLHDYLKLSPQQALQAVEQLIKITKSVEGLFCTIWHNNTLSDIGDWHGWLDVYEKTVEMAIANETP